MDTDTTRELGVDVTNDFDLPTVRIERPAIVKGNQFFKVTTARESFEFYVTPTGYLRVYGAYAPKRLQPPRNG